MNGDIFAGDWMQIEGKIRQMWGKLSGDDLELIIGRREELVGKIQHLCGLRRDEAEKQFRDFETQCRESIVTKA